MVALLSDTTLAISCNGRYQVLKNGSEISTPFCGDNYLATVSRKYGLKYSSREIRNNPNLKREVCDFIGDDSRVAEICASVINRPGTISNP